jgi:large subunit ribosomal protein MRP49
LGYNRSLIVCGRKFWRENLPRLKYWNPATPMIVNRHNDNSVPPTMTIYFRDDGATVQDQNSALHSSTKNESKAPLPADGERTLTIEMRNQHSTTILKEFLSKTGAVPVNPTPEELVEMQEAEELRRRGEVDRVRMKKTVDAAKREKSLMAQAKTEAAAFKATAV